MLFIKTVELNKKFVFNFFFKVRACEFISSTPNLFAAPQCLGYRNERGKATTAMCLPSFDVILLHLKRVIRNSKDVKSVFVASDNNYMIPELTKALSRMEVSVKLIRATRTNKSL